MLRRGICKAINIAKVQCMSYSTKSLSVVFFGSDAVSNPTLQLLYSDFQSEDGLIKKLEVVCTADKKEKHSNDMTESPIKAFCKKNDIPITQIPMMPNHSLKEWNPPESILSKQFDLCVVSSFGFFIPSSVIACFRDGGLNMHPSLLPKYRGPAPIHNAILNNDENTGISIITLNDKVIDTGKLLYQKDIKIDHLMHYPQLASILSLEGAMAIMDTLYNIDSLTPTDQDETKATYAPKISKELSFVDFSQITAAKAFSLYKALNYEYPLRVQWNEKTVILRSLRPLPETKKPLLGVVDNANIAPGGVVYDKQSKSLLIRCKDSWVLCDEMQVMPKSRNVVAHVLQHEFEDRKQRFEKFKGY